MFLCSYRVKTDEGLHVFLLQKRDDCSFMMVEIWPHGHTFTIYVLLNFFAQRTKYIGFNIKHWGVGPWKQNDWSLRSWPKMLNGVSGTVVVLKWHEPRVPEYTIRFIIYVCSRSLISRCLLFGFMFFHYPQLFSDNYCNRFILLALKASECMYTNRMQAILHSKWDPMSRSLSSKKHPQMPMGLPDKNNDYHQSLRAFKQAYDDIFWVIQTLIKGRSFVHSLRRSCASCHQGSLQLEG